MADIAVDNFEAFKSFYPTLDFTRTTVSSRTRSTQGHEEIDWNEVVPADFETGSTRSLLPDLTECQKKIGVVIFDVIAIAVGAVGLRATLRARTIERMATAIGPVLNAIEKIIAEIGQAAASFETIAYGVFRILKTIWDGGCFDAVWDAFLGNLTWYNALIYGVSGIATIVAAFATGGLALAAEIVLLLMAGATLVIDMVAMVDECGLVKTPAPPTPALDPDKMPIKASIAIRTASGNYLTATSNGGLVEPNSASVIATNRRRVGPWEQFKLSPIDMNKKTFALQTQDGHYLTATEGGGFGGPGGQGDSASPIQTDRRAVGPWEKFVLIKQPNGTYAISTTTGFYLTAMGGGGRGGPNNATSIIHTDATRRDKDETFTFEMLAQ